MAGYYLSLWPLQLSESFSSVESVKAASNALSPVNGKVLEVNNVCFSCFSWFSHYFFFGCYQQELTETPSIVNESPMEKGWFMKIEVVLFFFRLINQVTNPEELKELMDQATYEKFCKENEH